MPVMSSVTVRVAAAGRLFAGPFFTGWRVEAAPSDGPASVSAMAAATAYRVFIVPIPSPATMGQAQRLSCRFAINSLRPPFVRGPLVAGASQKRSTQGLVNQHHNPQEGEDDAGNQLGALAQ